MLDGDDYPSFDTVQKSTIQLAVDNTSEHFCVHRRQGLCLLDMNGLVLDKYTTLLIYIM